MPVNAIDEQTATEELGLRTAKAASFLISGRFIALIISAVMFIIVARLLGPSNYGIYVLIMSATGLIATVGNPNIGLFLKERVPRFKAKKKHAEVGVAMGDALLLSILIGLALLIISVILGTQISEYFLHSYLYVFALDVGLTAILFNLTFSTFNDALISINESEWAGGAAIIHSIVQAITSTYLVISGYGILGALIGFSLGLLVTSIVEIYIINRRYPIRLKIDGVMVRMKDTVNFAKHLTLSGIISSMLLYLSVIYLGFFELPATIGLYGVAQKIGSSLDVFISSIGLALIPMFSEAFVRVKSGIKTEKLFYYSVYFSLVFAAPAVMLLLIYAQELIVIFFTASYIGATPYLQLIAISLLLEIVAIFGPNLLIGKGKPEKVLKYAIIAGAIEAVAMISLTYYFGVIGMILAVFYVGNLVLGLLYINYIRKTEASESKTRLLKILKLIVANLVVAGVVAAILTVVPVFLGINHYTLTVILGIALYAVLYPIAATVLGAVDKNDIKIMRAAGNSLPFVGSVLQYVLSYATFFLESG